MRTRDAISEYGSFTVHHKKPLLRNATGKRLMKFSTLEMSKPTLRFLLSSVSSMLSSFLLDAVSNLCSSLQKDRSLLPENGH